MNEIKKNNFKSISVSTENHEELMAIAAQLSDKMNIPVSINSAVGILIKEHKDAQ